MEFIDNAIEDIIERFESSPNFRILCYENQWINHPDEYYVKPDTFKNVFKTFFGDINLQCFLSNFELDEEAFRKLLDFRNACHLLHSKLAYDEVECAYNQFSKLHARLQDL